MELMIALSLSGLVALVLGALAFYTSKRFMATTSEAELACSSRNALNLLVSDLRQMVSVNSFATNSITVTDLSGNVRTYGWSPQTRALTRTAGSQVKTLLAECSSLSFSMYSANPIDGQLDVQPTTKTNECKSIKVEWTCRRTNYMSAVVTKATVSDTVVMRFQGL